MSTFLVTVRAQYWVLLMSIILSSPHYINKTKITKAYFALDTFEYKIPHCDPPVYSLSPHT